MVEYPTLIIQGEDMVSDYVGSSVLAQGYIDGPFNPQTCSASVTALSSLVGSITILVEVLLTGTWRQKSFTINLTNRNQVLNVTGSQITALTNIEAVRFRISGSFTGRVKLFFSKV